MAAEGNPTAKVYLARLLKKPFQLKDRGWDSQTDTGYRQQPAFRRPIQWIIWVIAGCGHQHNVFHSTRRMLRAHGAISIDQVICPRNWAGVMDSLMALAIILRHSAVQLKSPRVLPRQKKIFVT